MDVHYEVVQEKTETLAQFKLKGDAFSFAEACSKQEPKSKFLINWHGYFIAEYEAGKLKTLKTQAQLYKQIGHVTCECV